ncbi:hypothetical protein K9N68_17350 [Kovacikia minuta CCNUW1]|uniref:hypothetical protein n=1 Tax=Kovacikia minuta TaxID=2931930 RepID=UPI001CCBC1E8|nr:hypothetical protein [Kovacikia minuta]UBF23556.1 hypothetical protein K9N68_17350 [Kovacikia minuta CCNUW1]
MKLILTVCVAMGWGIFAADAVFAQQVPRSSSPARSAQAESQSSKLADPGDRSIQRTGASLVAATGTRPCPADICREVRPTTPSYEYFLDSTLRYPLFYRSDTSQAGIFGRSTPDAFRNSILRSLFPLDEADASSELWPLCSSRFLGLGMKS